MKSFKKIFQRKSSHVPAPLAQNADSGACARITSVRPGSPADSASLQAGFVISEVNGQSLRDILDWRWLADEGEVDLVYTDHKQKKKHCQLRRVHGQDWGIEFSSPVFDEIKQCRNACCFCFMNQLPKDMRSSLYLKDDDYRLSFLSGSFITLTNLDAADKARIIEQHLSPLRVSLHASNPSIREKIMGKHARYGLEVLEELLEAGIEFYAQIVLLPGINDGDVLDETLTWAYAQENILGVGVVPLGFTRHQDIFTQSFNEPECARRVIEQLKAFQTKALSQKNSPWVYASDEFYRNAYGDQVTKFLPDAHFYRGFDMFEDGIGIIRSVIDEWQKADRSGNIKRCVYCLRAHKTTAYLISGFAQKEYLDALIAHSRIGECFQAVYVHNDYFGGNTDVTGLLCGVDIVRALPEEGLGLLPRVIFNEEGVTLDGMSLDEIKAKAKCDLHVVSCSPKDYFDELYDILSKM